MIRALRTRLVAAAMLSLLAVLTVRLRAADVLLSPLL